jgi:hypothetical protein
MSWLATTLRLYALVATRAARISALNWPVLLSVFVYFLVMGAALPVAFMLGVLGGFVLGLVWAACIASFLYLVERLVRQGRVSWDDFRRSVAPYFSDVIGVLFVLWILRTVLSLALMTNPQALLITAIVGLFVFVFFNAVPELIYLGHHSSLALLSESYRFISENWIEWFPPTLAAGGILYLLMGIPGDGLVAVGRQALVALFLYFTMVLRGLLFEELEGSTRRSRAFRYRS